jgi:Arc/MetJ-type ribon-helix-helix transcriptional regulator
MDTKAKAKTKKHGDYVPWNIPAPRDLDEAVEEAVKKGLYVSKSELVRDAVRRLLKDIQPR